MEFIHGCSGDHCSSSGKQRALPAYEPRPRRCCQEPAGHRRRPGSTECYDEASRGWKVKLQVRTTCGHYPSALYRYVSTLLVGLSIRLANAPNASALVFFALLLGFGVKLPTVTIHNWLP